MSIFRRRRPDGSKDRVYSYEFRYRNQRYRGTTGQRDKRAALKVEQREQDRVRRVAAGIEPELPAHQVRWQEWAEQYFTVKSRRSDLTRPERLEFLMRAVLKFWGAKPAPDGDVPIDPKAPYHDLLLADVVKDPYWLERFEQWMHERTLKPQTRNHYRGLCDQMFRLAIDPRFRQRTGVLINPFAGQPRDRVRSRKVTLAPDDVRQLLTHASYHVRLACAIGALAPTLRMASVLGLRWDRHLDRDLTIITVADHKTAARTGRAQVVPISAQLRAILEDARVRRPKRSPWVITYRRRPVKSIRGGVRNAAIAAGLPYGRDTRDGLTFHTLRHTASSLLRKVGVDPFLQRDFMGHEHLATTALYTHVSPEELAPAAEQLSAALPISDLVTLPRRRARRDGGQNGGESLPQSVKLPAVTSGLRRP